MSGRKQMLIDLGAETLAEALLDLALHSDEVEDRVERLLSQPQQNIERFKTKLKNLKRSNRFIGWKEASGFASELQLLLQDVKAASEDPLSGIELIAAFFEADSTILEMCDDSSGSIGDIFCFDAKYLFVEFASRCTDKEHVADIILKLNQDDNYGVRVVLVDCAGECLPESVIRSMIATLQGQADRENDRNTRDHYMAMVGSLARQIKDAKLYETIHTPKTGKPSGPAIINIARVYLESDDIEKALSWLSKLPEGADFFASQRDEILLEVYKKQGDTEKLADIFCQKFRSYYSTYTLQALLDVIGHDKQEEVVRDAISVILENKTLRASDAEFLCACGKIDEAEEYLLKHADQLDGNFYGSLLSLAETMESENRWLVSSLVYRSLLTSILERGYSKAYRHGVRYLRKLDSLAPKVSDWKRFPDHNTFRDQLILAHGRKRSFWSGYKG